MSDSLISILKKHLRWRCWPEVQEWFLRQDELAALEEDLATYEAALVRQHQAEQPSAQSLNTSAERVQNEDGIEHACSEISVVDEASFIDKMQQAWLAAFPWDIAQENPRASRIAMNGVYEFVKDHLRSPEPGSPKQLLDYINMAQDASNAEFGKTFVKPTIYFQAMEAAIKAVLDAAGVKYVP